MKRQPHITGLGFTLLSLLARRNRTGYELSRFTAPPRSVVLWSANHSNIYKELARLSKHGYVRFRTVKQARPQDKKVYRITASGLKRLREWAIELPRQHIIRREINIKAHAAWLVDPFESAKLFRKQVEENRELINSLSAHWKRLQNQNGLSGSPRPPHPLFGTHAVIRLEIAYRKELIRWCNWVEQSLTRSGRKKTSGVSRSRGSIRSSKNCIHAASED
ncbi:MAG TPA: PadR family transcriptional regulator [Pseudolabrys sp.]|jgi:DNA-binding PadR family transcriptional regulator|nr:PadR family transcriptional regulator [Pseudolabrys sp.]